MSLHRHTAQIFDDSSESLVLNSPCTQVWSTDSIKNKTEDLEQHDKEEPHEGQGAILPEREEEKDEKINRRKEGGWVAGRKGGRVGGREGGREGGWVGGWQGRREGGREGGRKEPVAYNTCVNVKKVGMLA